MKCFSVLLLIVSITLLINTSKTHAISDDIVIYQVQTGGAGSGTATEEFFLLQNTSDLDVNVTNWCVEYLSASFNSGFEVCIEPPDELTELWLEDGGLVSFSTASFDLTQGGFISDFAMSGGMAAGGGHVRVLDQDGLEVDKVGWGTASNPETLAAAAHSSGEVLSRDVSNTNPDTDNNLVDFSSQVIIGEVTSGLYEQEIIIDLCANIEGVQAEYPVGFLSDEQGACFEDFCPEIDGLQLTAPDGYEKLNGSSVCTLIPLEDAVLFITELLPNAPGVDSGQEFIELYNPNDRSISLSGYALQLGPGYTKEYVIESGTIAPGEYVILSDAVTDITLPNATGQIVRLLAPAGNTVSESAVYLNAADDVSWALVEDVWIFTNQITPAAANLPFLEAAVDEVLGVTSVLGPCPAGKFRNPDTNRCKNIETAVSQLKPCDEDEFRNPETNRCKKISSSSSSLGPCPEGQERNPETNRCRNVALLTNADGAPPTVSDVAVEATEGQINWWIITLAVGGTLAYIAYEWRHELSKSVAQTKQRLVQ